MDFFSEGIPPEVLEQMRQYHDLHEMSHDDLAHERQRFLDELNEDQLHALGLMMRGIQGSATSLFTQGYITALLHVKYDHCGCGTKHDMSQVDEASTPPTMPSEQEAVPLPDEQHEYREAKMKEYGLEEMPVPGNPSLTYIRCANCKQPYPSLDDRMRREPGPGGCGGCQQKTKWG